MDAHLDPIIWLVSIALIIVASCVHIRFNEGLCCVKKGITGLIVGLISTHYCIDQVWSSRNTIGLALTQHLLQEDGKDTEKPILLLVGSSFTARGINGELLARELSKQGTSVTVRQLSYPGFYAYAQDYYLDLYLEETKRTPKYVLVEFGSAHAVPERRKNWFTADALNYHDSKRTILLIDQVLFNPENSTIEIAKHSLNILHHFILNAFDVGIFFSRPAQTTTELDGYRPLEGAAAFFNPIKIPDGVGEFGCVQADYKVDRHDSLFRQYSNPATRRFKLCQRQRLLDRGVKVVAHYHTPQLSNRPYYAETVFDNNPHIPSIHPNYPNLMSQLHEGTWYDRIHLNDLGATIYTKWLALKISDIIRNTDS